MAAMAATAAIAIGARHSGHRSFPPGERCRSLDFRKSIRLIGASASPRSINARSIIKL
jgi:hypothetical protein